MSIGGEFMDYAYLCKKIGDMSSIPIRLYINNELNMFYSLFELSKDPFSLYESQIEEINNEVGYFITPDFDYYGIINGKDIRIILGPARLTDMSLQDYKRLAFLLEVPTEKTDSFIQALSSIHHIPLESILQILCSMNYVINGTKLEITDIEVSETMQNEISRQSEINIETQLSHNDDAIFQDIQKTYHVEETILDIVRHGDCDALEKWLSNPVSIHPGTLSSDLIRQYKNNMIIAISLYARAAIRGGMDLVDAMRLSDSYIQKIEHLQSLEQISNMGFHAVKEYTKSVNKARRSYQSELVNKVNSFIHHHISDNIKTEDIASHLYMSRSYLSSKFKKESGVSLNTYITLLKLEEAKHLLLYTDKSLSLISSYLGYSSQSYFCNTFKKYIGQTPKEYREGT